MPKKLYYTEKELPQRSEKWLKIRQTCIGGSDVAKILGLTPKFCTPQLFFKLRTGKIPPKEVTDAMNEGTRKEDEARIVMAEHLKEVEGIKNPKITPYFAKHPDFPQVGVSFDGVDLRNKFITEIKCPKYSWNFKSVFEDGIQDYYYPQIQLQLAVANAIWGINKAFFCSYFPDGAYILDRFRFVEQFKTLAVLDLEYDDEYFKKMLKVIDVFLEMIAEDKWDKAKYKKVLEDFHGKRTLE